mmetsp:Transcript_26550/g.48133  ORF Transcript_26550/g.48133 Transcript_26550/m.48133 type:complete len:306 (+) Transcript_26550:109-1026(+)
MNPFASSGTSKRSTDITAESWSNLAEGRDANDAGGDDSGGGGGFLNPQSTLPSNRDLQTSDWSKERSAQQLELSDVHDRTNPIGTCTAIFEFSIVKLLHVINFGCGFASIVYGSLLVSKFSEPAFAAATFCLILGVVHVSSSLMGMISYFWGGCGRVGLKFSAVVGPYVAFVYLTIVISLGVDESGFLGYLDENKNVLFMGPNVAANCRKLMPLFFTILIVLGLLEAFRYPILTGVQLRLLRKDEGDALIPASNNTTANAGLTEALLEEGGGGGGNKDDAESVKSGGGAVKRESTGTPNWWDGQE